MPDTKLYSRTPESFRTAAEEYVEKQLATMRKFGSARVLTPAEYCGLIDEVALVGQKMWIASGGTVKP